MTNIYHFITLIMFFNLLSLSSFSNIYYIPYMGSRTFQYIDYSFFLGLEIGDIKKYNDVKFSIKFVNGTKRNNYDLKYLFSTNDLDYVDRYYLLSATISDFKIGQMGVQFFIIQFLKVKIHLYI